MPEIKPCSFFSKQIINKNVLLCKVQFLQSHQHNSAKVLNWYMVILVYISVFKLHYIYSSIKIPSMKTNIIIIGYIHVYMNIHASQFLEKKWDFPYCILLNWVVQKLNFGNWKFQKNHQIIINMAKVKKIRSWIMP